MSDVAAAIGRVQLRGLPAWAAARRANAAYLDAHLQAVTTPPVGADIEHAYHQYTVRAPHRDRLLATLTRAGIGAAVFYPTPLHRTPAHRRAVELTRADTAAAEVLSIPVHPKLTRADLDRLVNEVNQ